MEQKYTSADTSLAIVNKIYTHYPFAANTRVLDYGGGKYDLNTEYMAKRSVTVSVYDKFNRTAEHNAKVLKDAHQDAPNYVVCSNVLNVIMEDEIIMGILSEIRNFKTKTIIAVYEGNGKGIGKETTKGYQRNQKLAAYIPMVEQYFTIISKKNGILECMPK